MITTEDDELADVMRLLSLHGISKDAWKRYAASGSWYYEVLYPGYKCNMTDIRPRWVFTIGAAGGFIKARRYARLYDEAFAEDAGNPHAASEFRRRPCLASLRDPTGPGASHHRPRRLH